LTDLAKYEELLHKVKEETNILHNIKRRKADRIGHILRRNCLLKRITEGDREGRAKVMGITRKKT
jgi:hypothetical protein